jgi:polar amino acid transport system permease protein
MEEAPLPGILAPVIGWLWTFLVAMAVAGLIAKVFDVFVGWSKKSALPEGVGGKLPGWRKLLMLLTLAVAAVLLGTQLVSSMISTADWSWFPKYFGQLLHGLWFTILLLVFSVLFGFMIAVPVGLVQVTGPKPLAWLASGFCTVIRGTPLLVQIWLLYYGLGSFFPMFPALRQSVFWPILSDGFYYAVLALTLSFAGYVGEIMRGAFLGVPKGELEAARAYGMSPFTTVRRIWFPRAFRIVLPTLGGEVIGQLKATPLASTVSVMELYGVAGKIKSNTFRTYEPLIMVAIVYFVLVYLLNRMIKAVEDQVPQKR